MKIRLCMAMLALCFMAGTAVAAPSSWTLDNAHSGIYFDAQHIFSTVRGHFEEYSGTLNIDTGNIPASSCSFTVRTKSIDTFNRKRDTHLRSAELFNSKAFPEMTFVSQKITAKGGNRYLIEGDLTIRGISKRVSAPFIYHGVKPNPFKKTQNVTGFTAQFTINRLDFKVGDGTYYTMGVIDKEVDVTISIEATQ